MKAFTMYRQDVPGETHATGTVNAPNEPQFEGIVFSDGTVAVRWLTECAATSVWDDMETLLQVHGHPEYGSILVWHTVVEDSPAPLLHVNFKADAVQFQQTMHAASEKVIDLLKADMAKLVESNKVLTAIALELAEEAE